MPILQENWNLQVQIVTITTKKVIPAVDSMKKQQQKKLLLKKNIPVADTAVDAADVVVGKTCRTHYRGTFDDGTQFDSSYDRGEPLEFVCGAGQMIHGYDKAVATMEVGQTINIHLMPEEAYGMPDPRAIFTLEIAQLPGSEDLEVGARAYLTNQYGQPFPVTVTEKTETNITFDANHEMAGKELNFQIELVEVK